MTEFPCANTPRTWPRGDWAHGVHIPDVRPVRWVMFPEGSRKVSGSLRLLSVRRCTELTMGAGTESES